uniref:Uncharacterized protein n=1 Tax=Steinernema glaseri TaxID=37863 RepID=A0A1I7Y3E7_9BILA
MYRQVAAVHKLLQHRNLKECASRASATGDRVTETSSEERRSSEQQDLQKSTLSTVPLRQSLLRTSQTQFSGRHWSCFTIGMTYLDRSMDAEGDELKWIDRSMLLRTAFSDYSVCSTFASSFYSVPTAESVSWRSYGDLSASMELSTPLEGDHTDSVYLFDDEESTHTAFSFQNRDSYGYYSAASEFFDQHHFNEQIVLRRVDSEVLQEEKTKKGLDLIATLNELFMRYNMALIE